MRKLTVRGMLLLIAAGCASEPPQPAAIEYRNVPEAYLLDCVMPPKPESTDDLSIAFVQAYRCGLIGNQDKARIRELSSSPR